MPRCLSLAPRPSADALEARYRQRRDAVERTHWQMRWLVSQGHTCPAVAALLGYSDDWGRTIVHRYNDAGPAGVTDRRHANPGQRLGRPVSKQRAWEAMRALGFTLQQPRTHATARPPRSIDATSGCTSMGLCTPLRRRPGGACRRR